MIKSPFDYKLVIAKPFQCIPACLEMIVQTMNIEINQSQIAEYFGLMVDENYHGSIANVKYTSDSNQLGIILQNDSVNKFFRDFMLPFKEEYLPIEKLSDWELMDTIMKELLLGSNLMCGYSYGILNIQEELDEIGHVSIIIGIDKEKIALLDPGPSDSGIKTYQFISLYKAIHKKKDGLWVIRSND